MQQVHAGQQLLEVVLRLLPPAPLSSQLSLQLSLPPYRLLYRTALLLLYRLLSRTALLRPLLRTGAVSCTVGRCHRLHVCSLPQGSKLCQSVTPLAGEPGALRIHVPQQLQQALVLLQRGQ